METPIENSDLIIDGSYLKTEAENYQTILHTIPNLNSPFKL